MPGKVNPVIPEVVSQVAFSVIGNDTAIKLAAEKTGYSPVYVNDGPMIDMLKQAEELAQSGDAVLLSPAAASWGIYDNYEQRGEIFKELVNKL